MRLVRPRTLLLVLFCLPVLSFAQEEIPFPDGCGNPFVADGVFGDFFEKAIQAGLIDKGSVTLVYKQLFAVDKIRKYMSRKYPNPEDGEAIDKHIRAQLCEFATGKTGLNSSSLDLQKHITTIAPRLLRDCKTLVSKLNAKENDRQKNIARYEARYGLIEKAEHQADEELRGLIR